MLKKRHHQYKQSRCNRREQCPEGTHLIKIKQLASSQFVTGAKLETDKNGNQVSLSTKLVDLGFDATQGTTIHIKTANKEVGLEVRKAQLWVI